MIIWNNTLISSELLCILTIMTFQERNSKILSYCNNSGLKNVSCLKCRAEQSCNAVHLAAKRSRGPAAQSKPSGPRSVGHYFVAVICSSISIHGSDSASCAWALPVVWCLFYRPSVDSGGPAFYILFLQGFACLFPVSPSLHLPFSIEDHNLGVLLASPTLISSLPKQSCFSRAAVAEF